MALGLSNEAIAQAMMNAPQITPVRGPRTASIGLPVALRQNQTRLVSPRDGNIVMPDGLIMNEMDTYGKDSTNIQDMNNIIQSKRASVLDSNMSKVAKRNAFRALNKVDKIHMTIGDASNNGQKPGRFGYYRPSTDKLVISSDETKADQQYIADHEIGHGANAGALNQFYNKADNNSYDANLNEDIVRMFSIRKNLPSKYKDTSSKDFVHPLFFYNPKTNEFENSKSGYFQSSKFRQPKSGKNRGYPKYSKALDDERVRLNMKLLDSPQFADDMKKAFSSPKAKFQFVQLKGSKRSDRKSISDKIGFDFSKARAK